MNDIRIDVQPTPNPNALKFTLDRPTTDGAPRSFRNAEEATDHAAAAAILALGGVTGVFATANFISVNKADAASWDALVPEIVRAIQAAFGGTTVA